LELKAADAVACRRGAMGLDHRRSVRFARSLAYAAATALPDYPKGAAARALAARCDGVVDADKVARISDEIGDVMSDRAGDAFLHQRDRATLVPDADHRKKLWRPAGAPGLVLIGGTAAGVWRQKQAKDHLDVTADRWTGTRGDKRLTSALHDEAVTLAAADPTLPTLDDVEVTIN
jgi:hypothetical protein